MASTYGYSTIVKLELYSSEDYGTIDATYLTDAHVDAKITAAEQAINTYLGKTFTGTIPDAIELSTNIIASRIILKWLMLHAFNSLSTEQIKEAALPLICKTVEGLLAVYKSTKVSPIKLHRLYNNDQSVYY